MREPRTEGVDALEESPRPGFPRGLALVALIGVMIFLRMKPRDEE